MNDCLPDVAIKPAPAMPEPASTARGRQRISVFAWPSWLRVLAVLPACAVLWLGVRWALA